MHMCSTHAQKILIKIAMLSHHWLFESELDVHELRVWVGGTIDMLDFTLYIIPNSMRSLRDLSYLEIILQKAPSHISMVMFIV